MLFVFSAHDLNLWSPAWEAFTLQIQPLLNWSEQYIAIKTVFKREYKGKRQESYVILNGYGI